MNVDGRCSILTTTVESGLSSRGKRWTATIDVNTDEKCNSTVDWPATNGGSTYRSPKWNSGYNVWLANVPNHFRTPTSNQKLMHAFLADYMHFQICHFWLVNAFWRVCYVCLFSVVLCFHTSVNQHSFFWEPKSELLETLTPEQKFALWALGNLTFLNWELNWTPNSNFS